MRRTLFAVCLLVPGLALAQAPAAPPAAPAESPDAKHDQGTVRTVDTQKGLLIADLPDGPVTYDVSRAQLLDVDGKPQGSAVTGLKTGDKVRITYVIENGAKVSEIRIVK